MKKRISRYELNENTHLDASDIHPMLRNIYLHRGIQSADELDNSLKNLLPFQSLLGIETAVQLLVDAIQQQQRILIVGDYDVDGATSTAVMLRILRAFGATNVSYLIPNRFGSGYGLTAELVEMSKEFSPDLIVTVDNGITSHAGVDAAHALGIKVLVTDHHLAMNMLPAAEAIVNPNQPSDPFESKHLAGVGVAFYVMMALRAKLRELNWFAAQGTEEPNLADYLDLVALGTVADLVPLDHNNRILVQQGLLRIRAEQSCPGIQALIQVAKRTQLQVVASDLAFAIAPRVNAAGRLDEMSLGVACLLADTAEEARKLAQQLDTLNQERRDLELQMRDEALMILEDFHLNSKQQLPMGLCLMNEKWHQGIVGIVASKLKDRLNRPVIVFAPENEGLLKGSGRSIQSIHLRDVLDHIALHHPEIMTRFGGHAMAAGLSLKKEHYHRFQKVFDETVKELCGDTEMQETILSDGSCRLQDLSLDFVSQITMAAPWGCGFPEPVFDDHFRVIEQRLVGRKHLKLLLEKDSRMISAIAFNIDVDEWPNYGCDTLHMAYRVGINEYQGSRTIQLVAEYLDPVAR